MIKEVETTTYEVKSHKQVSIVSEKGVLTETGWDFYGAPAHQNKSAVRMYLSL